MVDTIASDISQSIFIQTQTAVVFHLDTQVFCFGVLPEIEAAGNLKIPLKWRVLRIIRMNVIIEVDEREGRAPGVSVEQFQRSCYAIRSLIRTRCSQTTEIIKQLQVCSCVCAYSQSAEKKDNTILFHR